MELFFENCVLKLFFLNLTTQNNNKNMVFFQFIIYKNIYLIIFLLITKVD